jgi:hypothetical protein
MRKVVGGLPGGHHGVRFKLAPLSPRPAVTIFHPPPRHTGHAGSPSSTAAPAQPQAVPPDRVRAAQLARSGGDLPPQILLTSSALGHHPSHSLPVAPSFSHEPHRIALLFPRIVNLARSPPRSFLVRPAFFGYSSHGPRPARTLSVHRLPRCMPATVSRTPPSLTLSSCRLPL